MVSRDPRMKTIMHYFHSTLAGSVIGNKARDTQTVTLLQEVGVAGSVLICSALPFSVGPLWKPIAFEQTMMEES